MPSPFPGMGAAAAGGERLDDQSRFDYLTVVRLAAEPAGLRVQRWGVRRALPPLAVPLAPGETELPVPLQPLFDRAYDNAAFTKLVDYATAPEPPLREGDAVWADSLLRAAGLRGAPGA